MPGTEASKPQVLRAVNTAIFVLDQAVESCGTVEDAAEIPKAFCVVARHLPVVGDVFGSVRAQLQSSEETDQITELYPVIKQVADESCGQIRSLEDLFDTVTRDAEGSTKMERYAAEVKRGDGKKVETHMIDLLNNARLVAVEPFVSEEQIAVLKGALEEVKGLPPSLKEEQGAGVILNNNGSGTQFYHAGNGNQNHCSGGFQVNGRNHNAKYTYAEKAKEDDREKTKGDNM